MGKVFFTQKWDNHKKRELFGYWRRVLAMVTRKKLKFELIPLWQYETVGFLAFVSIHRGKFYVEIQLLANF
jgi:hypothetical protein